GGGRGRVGRGGCCGGVVLWSGGSRGGCLAFELQSVLPLHGAANLGLAGRRRPGDCGPVTKVGAFLPLPPRGSARGLPSPHVSAGRDRGSRLAERAVGGSGGGEGSSPISRLRANAGFGTPLTLALFGGEREATRYIRSDIGYRAGVSVLGTSDASPRYSQRWSDNGTSPFFPDEVVKRAKIEFVLLGAPPTGWFRAFSPLIAHPARTAALRYRNEPQMSVIGDC